MPVNTAGRRTVTKRDLLEAAVAHRPDGIIEGALRGGGAFDPPLARGRTEIHRSGSRDQQLRRRHRSLRLLRRLLEHGTGHGSSRPQS